MKERFTRFSVMKIVNLLVFSNFDIYQAGVSHRQPVFVCLYFIWIHNSKRVCQLTDLKYGTLK